MRIKSILSYLAFTVIMAFASAHATTLFVATSGSDSNPGTSAQPFRTITHAYSLAGPGTTISVAPGTYTDYSAGWGLHLYNNGTAIAPIVLQSQVPGGAVIDGQFATNRNKGIYLDGSYNIIDGFVITRAPGSAIFIEANSNQILNNEIYNNGSVNEGQGIYSDQGTSGNVYENNYIHDNGLAGSNLDHGLYLCGQNEVVANNIVVRNAAAGLQIAGYTLVSNMKVYNNVFAWNGTSGVIVWMAMGGVDIKNNIIYENGHYGIGFYAATGSGVNMDHNLVYASAWGDLEFTGGSSTCSYTLGTTLSSDPLFVNDTSASFDAHLASGSPAIGAGLNLSSLLTIDITGALRVTTGNWDLGAYAYGSATPTNVTPPTVSITSPANNTTVSGSGVTVTASAASSVGIASVQFKLDGTNIGSAFTASPYGGSWNSTLVSNGSHKFSAVATDTAGNQTTTAPVAFFVTNLPPAVALTSPVNGAKFVAPATIKLTASVVTNGHTITQVEFFNGNTLLGSATSAPYSFTWSNLTAAMYGVSATAVYDSGSTVACPSVTVTVTNPPASSSLTFASTSGTISGPFYVTNKNAIVQSAYTSLSAGGQAVYTFNINTTGNYVVSALVLAPSQANNSLFVNIDAQPTDPTMVWDIPLTSALANETMSWRGNGTASSTSSSGLTAQYAPKVFRLSAGTHQLIVRGREALTQLGTITIAPTTLPAN